MVCNRTQDAVIFTFVHDLCSIVKIKWGRVDISSNSLYTNNAFDKLHYQKHTQKQDFA